MSIGHSMLQELPLKDSRFQMPLVDKLQQALLLAKITNEIRQSLETETIFETAVTQVQAIMQADRVAIFQLDQGSENREGAFVAEKVVPDFDSALTAMVRDNYFAENYANRYREGRVLATTDIYTAGLSECHLGILAQFQIRANLVVPLLQGDLLWGLLCIHQCSGPREWQPSEIDFIQKLADQLSIALQQAALLEATQEHSLALQRALKQVEAQKEREAMQACHERNLNQIVQHIRHSLDIEDIFAATTEDLRQSLSCDRVVIYRFFPDWSGEFMSESASPELTPLAISNRTLHWTDTCIQEDQGARYREGHTTVVTDIYQQSYSDCHLAMLERLEIRALMVVPVFVGETLWGLLAAYQAYQSREWQTIELTLLSKVSAQLGVALQQANLIHQLREAKHKAEAANQAKGAFLASMSHELRTPLNAILGFSQLLTRDQNLTLEQKRTLKTINRSGSHLLDLINDVLEISKIEAGKVNLNRKDFDLHGLLESLYDMFHLKAESRQLHLIFDRAPDVPQFIHGDEGRFRQVLINLLGNALKFTEMGTVKMTVTQHLPDDLDGGQSYHPVGKALSGALPQQMYLYITVQDTGIGIAQGELESLFDVFTQATSDHHFTQGTGLGLAICRQFVHLMQGEIEIESQEGQGTTVYVRLPVAIATASQVVQDVCAPKVIGLAPAQDEWRILVAEDHLDSQHLLVQLLQTVGFAVEAVNTGQAAIDRWQSWAPHLVFMDWHMPVMGGAEATQTIRRLEASPDLGAGSNAAGTIVLALTASVFENTQEETHRAGCNGFLCKPFYEDALFQAIGEHLGVEYVYDTSEGSAQSEQQWTDGDWHQHLSRWPRQQLLDLNCAAIELDEDQVERLLALNHAYDSVLSAALGQLSQTLQFGKMADYAQAALALQEGAGSVDFIEQPAAAGDV